MTASATLTPTTRASSSRVARLTPDKLPNAVSSVLRRRNPMPGTTSSSDCRSRLRRDYGFPPAAGAGVHDLARARKFGVPAIFSGEAAAGLAVGQAGRQEDAQEEEGIDQVHRAGPPSRQSHEVGRRPSNAA